MSHPVRTLGQVSVLSDSTAADTSSRARDAFLVDAGRHRRELLAHCYRMTGSLHDAEDLVQETYLRALGSIDRYRGDAPVRTWLLAIGRHVCADHVRRRQRQRRIVERIVATTPADPGEPGPSPIDDLLDGLDANRREAFVLTQMLGLTYDEAAEVIGCPVGTIRSRVARARADLMDAVHRSEAAGG